ncbi:MAG: phage holin family protein [Burkholderiaceae bacterium]
MNASAVPPGGGLASTAGAAMTSVLKLIGVRLSMAVLELGAARNAVFRVLLLAALAVLAAAFALLSVSAMIVALAWDALGWRILLLLCLAYLVLAIAMLLKARNIILSGQIGLPMTLAELQKDREALADAQTETEQNP